MKTNYKPAMGFYVAFLVSMLFLEVRAIDDYCSKNTYNDSDNYMHFSKEATFEEFALRKKFKGLNCCAKGYRSIEWYKDDKPYPWAREVSKFILLPESANQTIYTNEIREEDEGNYTCVLKNDTVIHSHTIYLKVFEKAPDDPKITYFSHDSSVVLDQSLRLFCEAFAGQVDLPDAHSEVYWKKVSPNGTVYDLPAHIDQIKTYREEGQTFGTYLLIQKVKKDDLGQYLCTISKPGNTIERSVWVREQLDSDLDSLNPNHVPIGRVILLLSALLFSTFALVIFYLQFGLKLQVRLKEAFERPRECIDGKIYDFLFVYSPQDSEIALGVLAPTLEDQFGYRCRSMELPIIASTWYTQLKSESEKCHTMIVVLSPNALNEKWDTNTIINSIKQLQTLCPKLICIFLQELPKNDGQGDSLKSISKSVDIIVWRRKAADNKFWLSLRLKLPPKMKRNDTTYKSDTNELRLNGISHNIPRSMV